MVDEVVPIRGRGTAAAVDEVVPIRGRRTAAAVDEVTPSLHSELCAND